MIDPRKKFADPPFPKQIQDPPALEKNMEPLPDWGKDSYKGSGKLKGQVAIITGGDSGIGRAVAWAYANEGAKVVISYLNEHEDVKVIEDAIREMGGESLLVPGDIQSEDQCENVVKKAVEKFGQIDILVNNAAYQMGYQTLDEVTYSEFDRAMKTNVYATFFMTKHAVRHMAPGSSIINTSSIVAYQAHDFLIPYAATKSAIVNLTRTLGKKLIKEKGIRVNAVAPGPIWTPIIPASFPEEKVAEHGGSSWIGRAGQPAEIAPVFVFLASEEASYVIGQVYGVTGGMGFP